MENFLKKISEGKCDESVHLEFTKFGKGTFENKYLIDAKKQKSKWSVKTSAEFANFLVRKCLESAGGKISVKGVIVSTLDLKDDIKFPIDKIKQYMGIKQLIIKDEINKNELIDLMNKFPKAFYALSFSTPICDLKIKAKAPKGAKPSSKGEKEVKADFCSLKTTDKSIIEDLLFDCKDFDKVSINHTLKIDEIILPEGEEDPKKIREKAIRKGRIIRKIEVDGKETEKELPFEC